MDEGPTRVRPATRVARYEKLAVSVTAGPDAGLELVTAGEAVRVGTAPDNDLVLADDSVSRHHCELQPTADGLRVRDAGSTNGVWLGAIRLNDALLTGGVELRLGDTTLSVRALGESVDREQATAERFGDVLGRAACMRELFAQLARIADTDYTLLVEGETGTGKDLVAESVHRESRRADEPFVVLDCGAVSPHVIESEIFGHERGAFTGAVDTHPGVFEQAHGGTLFIDEIGELPLPLQPKLLRVLEKRQLRRVGGTKTLEVDVRVISATNRNLRAEVRRGRFRDDLYYRLAAAHVRVPPLRDRLEDLELLVAHFLAQEAPPRALDEVAPHIWDMFRAHRWPGNVRELRNAVQRLAISPDRPLPDPPGEPGGDPLLLPLREARRLANDAFEQRYVRSALAQSGGSVTRAAALAEISRQMLQKLMKKHGMRGG